MARVFKLKRNTTELNLLAGAASGLRTQGWYPKMADIQYGYIPPYPVENLDILADRDTDPNLASTLQALDQMRRWADMYQRDRNIQHPVWLHAKMEGETTERRAFVRRITGDWRSNQIGIAGEPAAHDAKLRLAIERHPYWEPTSTVSGSNDTATGASDFWNPATAGVGGDVMARIAQCTFGVSANGLERLWVGFRSKGTPTNFAKIWECEAGVAGTDCSKTTDATASPGGAGNTKCVVNFSTTPGWAKRVSLYGIHVAGGNYLDQIARSLWLLRAKVDAGTECEVQLRFGMQPMADDDFIRNHIVSLSSTTWDYKEMGEGSIPPLSMMVQTDPGLFPTAIISASVVQIWARRTSGSGSLHLDCLCPVPIDEGWLVVKDIGITGAGSAYCNVTPDDRLIVHVVAGGYAQIPTWSCWNFGFPPETAARGIIVFARTATASDIADTLSLQNPDFYRRWANLAG